MSCLTKGCFSLKRHLQDHVAPFYFSQAVTLPARVADVLGCTLLDLFLCSQDKSGAKDRVVSVSCVWSPGACQGSTSCNTGAGLWLISPPPPEDILDLKTLRFSSFCLQLGECVQAPLHLFVCLCHGLSDTLFHSKMSSLKLRAWFASSLYLFQTSKSGSCDWSECLPALLCLVQVRTRAQCCSFLHQLLIWIEEHLS